MIQLVDVVECDGLEKSIVKLEAFRRAVLVQDASAKDDLFALVMVDDKRAVLMHNTASFSEHARKVIQIEINVFNTCRLESVANFHPCGLLTIES